MYPFNQVTPSDPTRNKVFIDTMMIVTIPVFFFFFFSVRYFTHSVHVLCVVRSSYNWNTHVCI